MRGEDGDDERADAGDRRRDDQRQPAAAAEKTAQQRQMLVFGVFGNEPLRGRAEAEIDHAADEQHPSPGIDVDAEFEAAHPAREQNLRAEGEKRADHADQKGRAGETPRQRGVAAVGKERAQPLYCGAEVCVPRRAPVRTRRMLRSDRCHKNLCTRRRERSSGRHGTVSKEALRFGWKKLTITAGTQTAPHARTRHAWLVPASTTGRQ